MDEVVEDGSCVGTAVGRRGGDGGRLGFVCRIVSALPHAHGSRMNALAHPHRRLLPVSKNLHFLQLLPSRLIALIYAQKAIEI